ncbi:hypothetical protein Nepgr_022085 [Nepenthes gracilis]|uniref:Secreted protein n=1 Tax=Nepenthes gracilis TaxID=150966 RepID=A0AAD3T038_NEPGR|nr:hypothetical protein Nepgr_022085 [Nepenthes gracilis]
MNDGPRASFLFLICSLASLRLALESGYSSASPNTASSATGGRQSPRADYQESSDCQRNHHHNLPISTSADVSLAWHPLSNIPESGCSCL